MRIGYGWVAALPLALALSGCFGSFGGGVTGSPTGGGGNDDRTAKPHAVTVEAPPTVEVKSEVASGSDRIRTILAKAEGIRLGLLGDPEYDRYAVQVVGKGGDESTRVFALMTFRSNTRELSNARQLYEAVLSSDPGNQQALLGLGNLALMEAMTLETERQGIQARLAGPDVSSDERPRLERRSKLVQKKLDSALAAAQNKFKMVIASAPSESGAHLGLGVALALAKDWNGAFAKFEQMEKGGAMPAHNRSVVYVWWGFVLEQNGNRDGAIVKYSLASELQEPYSWAEWADRRVEELYEYQ